MQIEFLEKEKKNKCVYHTYALPQDFIEIEIKKTGKKVIKCRFCVRVKEENKAQLKREWEKEKENLTDYYIRRLFVHSKGNSGMKLSMHEYPQELVELKRAILKVKRQAEKKEKPLKFCNKHGDLYEKDLIKAGKNASGTVRYKCKECQKIAHSDHYQRNKQKLLDKQLEWRKKNPEIRKEQQSRHRQKMTPEQREQERIRNKRYREKHNDILAAKSRNYKRKAIDTLSDYYVKKLLIEKKGGFKKQELTPELIDLKRQLVLLKRSVKTKERI